MYGNFRFSVCDISVLRFAGSCSISQFSQNLYASSSQPSLPVIRIPKGLEKKAQSVQSRKTPLKWRGRIFTSRPGTELISSKRKEFNHYMNQEYNKFAPPKLASQGWKHSKSRGDHFSILAYKGNPSFVSKNSNDKIGESRFQTFDNFKLSQSLIDGLEVMDIDTPTSIQISAIPVIMQGRNTLCAAETGSGKTLAYLLPLMQRLLEESRLGSSPTTEGCPKSIILVPVGELTEQVLGVAKVLAESVGLIVQRLDGEMSLKSIERKFFDPVDIVVSTPGPLINAVRKGFANMSLVTHVVIDESDTMLDDSFVEQTLRILRRITIGPGKPCRVTPPGEAQLTLLGATMPRKATSILADIIPKENLEIISTPHLHRIMPHVHQKFFRLHSDDKAVKIVELLKKESKRKVRTMIFCNTTQSCDWLAHHLTENGLKVLRLNSKMGGKSRTGVMSSFTEGEANILVCTDIASRGVDTIQVQHVINFDFPQFMSDYIHRTGRVGRVGSQSSGHVTSFIVHRWDVDLVCRIERAVRAREDLPRVDANIKRSHQSRMDDADLQDVVQALR